MSYLDKLLDGDGAEWKRLEEVSKKISSGGTPNTGVSEYYDGDIPWLRTQEVGSGDIWDTEIKITEAGLKNSSATMIPENCVIIAMYGATVGKVGVNKIRLSTNQACANIQLNAEMVHYRYAYHFLLSQYEYIKSLGAGSQTNINAKIVKNLRIPIPCPDNPQKSLEIQKEIVRILDTFTQLTAELTAELTARKQQYEYYRDKLLKFNELAPPLRREIKWSSLGEIAEIKRGVAFTKKQAVFGKFPVVANAAEPISFHNEFNRDGEFIVVARSGANAGLISYWNEELFLTDAFSIHPNDSVLNVRFAFYFLKKRQREIHLMKEGSGVPHVRASDFEIYKIPVPSMEEQVRIVEVLDKFDTLTTSISEGLPKEIALRKKQYEYYREMLLSFPKKDNK